MIREALIVFTRFPRAGFAKTRLIPRLGKEGAAQLQREMTEHTVARVWPLLKKRGVKLQVRFANASQKEMRRWLGHGFDLKPQGDGDLGMRLCRAANDAFASGAQAVIIIGADCPELEAALLSRAYDLLQEHPLVFGPAKDGGYYLIGLRTPMPQLFDGIDWGTSRVLAASLTKARESGLTAVLLPELCDVDEPADLELWEKLYRAHRTISVVVPTLNEAPGLASTLQFVTKGQPLEVIVTDGGSRDGTIPIAQSQGVRVLTGGANRARQMNAGAAVARGEILLFVHADTRLPANYCRSILEVIRQPCVVGGAFDFKLQEAFRGRWFVEFLVNMRSRHLRLPYGDQALFVRRWVFDELKGFPDMPIMEDYEFVRRLRRFGELALIDDSALTSARRWKRLGVLRTTLINTLIILGYHCRIPPTKLAALYRRESRN